MPIATGVSEKLPASNLGSVRTIGVVRGGMCAIAARGWSGGLTWMFQSPPTCWCALSWWLRSAIARYEVDTTSSPIDSSSSSAAANPMPGDAPSRRNAR